MTHLEDHSLIIRCNNTDALIRVYNALKHGVDGFNEDYFVNILADYNIKIIDDKED